MEAKVKPEKYVAPSPNEEALTGPQTETRPRVSPATDTDEKWRRFGEQIGTQTATFLARLPEYLSQFFEEYKGLIVSIALIVAAIIGLQVVVAVMNVLNGIPLLSPTLELLGISFTGWVVFRYLLKASTRQELADEIQRFKDKIVGSDASETLS